MDLTPGSVVPVHLFVVCTPLPSTVDGWDRPKTGFPSQEMGNFLSQDMGKFLSLEMGKLFPASIVGCQGETRVRSRIVLFNIFLRLRRHHRGCAPPPLSQITKQQEAKVLKLYKLIHY